MNDTAPITRREKFEAFICRICPVCILARRRPHSRFAAVVNKAEANCRFCRAYRKLHPKP